MSTLRVLLVCLLCTACSDPPPVPVSETQIGDIIQKEVRQSCRTPGFCYTCAPGFDMKMSCKMKMSPLCPGERDALVSISTFRVDYDDGSGRDVKRSETLKAGVCAI